MCVFCFYMPPDEGINLLFLIFYTADSPDRSCSIDLIFPDLQFTKSLTSWDRLVTVVWCQFSKIPLGA